MTEITKEYNARILDSWIGFTDDNVAAHIEAGIEVHCSGFNVCIVGQYDSNKSTTFQQFIDDIMMAADVTRWDRLTNKVIRIKMEGPYNSGRIIKIGHIIDERWYEINAQDD